MAKITLYAEEFVNGAAAHHVETQSELRKLKDEVEERAKGNLRAARATTQWDKIADPEHLTQIGSDRSVGKYGAVDYVVWMEAYKQGAMALEFGHAPSGVFGPGGKLSHIVTRATAGLYILTRAALLGSSPKMSSGRKRGKR